MKSTKTLLFAALAAGSLLVGSQALAQDSTNAPAATPPAGPPPGRAMRGGPTLDQLTKALDLTDDQKAKVKPILEARDQKMKDLRADTALSPEDRRTKMQGIRQDTLDQMKAVLTPDQFDKYQKMGQQRQRRIAPPAADNNAPPANPPAAPPQQ